MPAYPCRVASSDLREFAKRRASSAGVRRSGYQPPATGVEATIADVWCDVLNLGRVDLRDNFFDLGGDSLLITQVRSQLEGLLEHTDINHRFVPVPDGELPGALP